MFKEEYLLELLSGKLTSRGYANILGTITSMVRKYQWKKSIIVSDHNDNDWQSDDIKELSHQSLSGLYPKIRLSICQKCHLNICLIILHKCSFLLFQTELRKNNKRSV